MSNHTSEPGHGDSPAAWTAVIVMLLGIAVGTVALYLAIFWLVLAGAVVVVLGLILGAIIAKAGYGVNGPKFVPKSHD